MQDVDKALLLHHEQCLRLQALRRPYIRFRIGDKVVTTMGVRKVGEIVFRMFKYTDGSYRDPHDHERPIFVQWEDGSCGWSHRVHICHVNEEVHLKPKRTK